MLDKAGGWWYNKDNIKEREEIEMTDCRYCVNVNNCPYLVSSDDCEDYEETFEHHWEMMDDIEREEYNSYFSENEE